MADKLNINGGMQWVRADRLTVDPVYQRDRNERKIRKIVTDFDADAFGALYISKRANGEHVILDGQQRHAAIERLDWMDQQLPCVVYVGLTVAQEAALFVQYNEIRTKPRPMDIHRANVVAGEKRALALETVATARGLTIGEGNNAGRVQAIASLQQIYDGAGIRTVERTLDVLLHAYGAKAEAFNGEVMVAVAVIIARHHDDLDLVRLSRTLSRIEPVSLVRKARILKSELDVTGGSLARVSTVVAGIILKAYNTRLKEDQRVYFEMDRTGPLYWKVDQ